MTDTEVSRLQEQISFNENCKYQAGIYEFLLQNYCFLDNFKGR